MRARVWITAPDCLDGYFVELLSSHGKLEFQDDAEWFPTIQACKDWATRKGAQAIEEL